MSDKIIINEYDLSKTQIGWTQYQISIFRGENFEFQFNFSLQPTGIDVEFPTYQPTDDSHTIPKWIKENLNAISDWIKREAE